MLRPRRLTRRAFLKDAASVGRTAAAASLAPYVITSSALGAGPVPAASRRIAMGFIGLGGEGMGKNLRTFLGQPQVQAVAVCDVDAGRCAEGRRMVEEAYAGAMPSGAYRGCAATGDFREIVARPDVDAVMVGTPDHWHVLISIAAARAGKDVFCEKPLTLTVAEGRALADTIARYGRVFQTASEFRATATFHRAAELVRNGRIGKLQIIRTWLPGGHSVQPASQDAQPPPKGFDYDMWLGPAPWAPYSPARCHWNFRWILDYSGGQITDWGAHLNDIAQWGHGTELTGPVEVEGRGEFPRDGLYNTATKYEVTLTYADGVRLICSDGRPGVRFEGADGWVQAYYGGPVEAQPPSVLRETIGPDEIHLYTAPSEHRNFIDCFYSRRPCYGPAEVGHRTITLSHLGNIAMLTRRKLRWNPRAERFVDDPGADRYLARPMRAPWTL